MFIEMCLDYAGHIVYMKTINITIMFKDVGLRLTCME